MTSYSSKSRRNLTLILSAILLASFILLSQAYVNSILKKSQPKIVDYLENTFAYRFNIEGLSFNFLRGLSIKNAYILSAENNLRPIQLKSACISLELLPLLFQRTFSIHADIKEADILITREKDGLNPQIIFSDICKSLPSVKLPILSTFKNRLVLSANSVKLTYVLNSYFDKNIYLVLKNIKLTQDAERFKYSTDIDVYCHLTDDLYIAKFFQNKDLKERIHCSAQGRINGNSLAVNLILLGIGKDQIIGMGTINGFTERNPYLDIAFTHSAIALNNITSFRDNFSAEGSAFFALRLHGPMDNTTASYTGNIHYCNLTYTLPNGELYNIEQLNGDLSYKDGVLKIDKSNLNLNSLPLNISVSSLISDEPDITLAISIPKEFLHAQELPLDKLDVKFQGKLGKTLQGKLQLSALYLRKGSTFNMQAELDNVDYDYSNMQERYFKATSIELLKQNNSKIQKLKFTDLTASILTGKNKITIDNACFHGYHSTINSTVILETIDKPSLKVSLEGAGIDVKSLMPDINISNKLLSGNMDISIYFDNRLKNFLKGECYIKDGAVNMSLLAEALKLPALENVNFDTFSARFDLSKELIKADKVSLISPELILGAFWDTNGKIEGTINLQVSTRLLNQSGPFKKLLNLTRINKPYVEFDFLLGGLPKNVRAQWSTGEFKEKIKQELPGWIKKRIEKELNSIVDKLQND